MIIITDFTSLKFLASASLALLLVEASSYALVVVGAALLMSLNSQKRMIDRRELAVSASGIRL